MLIPFASTIHSLTDPVRKAWPNFSFRLYFLATTLYPTLQSGTLFLHAHLRLKFSAGPFAAARYGGEDFPCFSPVFGLLNILITATDVHSSCQSHNTVQSFSDQSDPYPDDLPFRDRLCTRPIRPRDGPSRDGTSDCSSCSIALETEAGRALLLNPVRRMD